MDHLPQPETTSAPVPIPAVLQNILERQAERRCAEQASRDAEEQRWRPENELRGAAYAISCWHSSLWTELGRKPTAGEAAERFVKLGCEFQAVLTRHQLHDFFDVLTPVVWGEWDDAADAFRGILSGESEVRKAGVTYLLEHGPPRFASLVLSTFPLQLLDCVNAYFRVRSAPDPLTFGALSGLLHLTSPGVRYLELRWPAVSELRQALAELQPEMEFSTTGLKNYANRLDEKNRSIGLKTSEESVQNVLGWVRNWMSEEKRAVPAPKIGEKGGPPADPDESAVQPKGQAGGAVAVDFFPLNSWAEIIDALNKNHPDRPWKNDHRGQGKIRALNTRFNGPIRLPDGKGRQPEVDRAKLLSWWHTVAEQFSTSEAEDEQEEASEAATVATTHPHGKDGTVVPNLHGSVKKSKRNGKV